MSERGRKLAIKYRLRLEKELRSGSSKAGVRSSVKASGGGGKRHSLNYEQFKKASLTKPLSFYEKACNFFGKILQINPGTERSKQLEKLISLAQLNTTPSATVSLGIFVFLFIFIFSGVVWVITDSVFLFGYVILMGLFVMFALFKLPDFFANTRRLQASNQMVQCVFYVASFLRHTSNIELAIRFAAERLFPPLSYDFKKVMWDVQTNKYGTIRESLDNYLETWRGWNDEFIESLNLISASLYEPSETKRLSMIDKGLNVMLDETYERMLRYSHDLKNPITMLYMLGLVLPILGLVILPLVAAFTGKTPPLVLAAYIALIYNLTLPLILYYLTKTTLSKRPTGYGEVDISNQIPDIKKYVNVVMPFGTKRILISPLLVSLVIGVGFLLVGILPLALQFVIDEDILRSEQPFLPSLGFKFLDYKFEDEAFQGDGPGLPTGPYGIGAAVLSVFIPLALGVGFGLYLLMRSKNVFAIRERSKKLENEFASALFQLGNRIGDGIPAEVAVENVISLMKGSFSAEFFTIVSFNMRQFGMNLESSIFDRKRGALNYFPSRTIESVMKVLIESSKKGPKSASLALINISAYMKDIHRVNERLRDLMADIISDVKQQVSVLAPAIAGIVVGVTSMIIGILGQLRERGKEIGQLSSEAQGDSGIEPFLDTFGSGIPTYYFQIIIGVYIVQAVYVMSILINDVEFGSDRLSERYLAGNNMVKSTIVYVIIALAIMVLFNALSSSIIGSLETT